MLFLFISLLVQRNEAKKRHHAQKLSNFAFTQSTHFKGHAKFGVRTGRGQPTHKVIADFETELKFFSSEILEADHTHEDALKEFQTVYLGLLDHQRELLDKINHHAEYDEEIVRKYLALVDLEEFKVREKMVG